MASLKIREAGAGASATASSVEMRHEKKEKRKRQEINSNNTSKTKKVQEVRQDRDYICSAVDGARISGGTFKKCHRRL